MRIPTRTLGTTLAAFALMANLSSPVWAQDVDFGDDSSEWAQDGECDDPRFFGSAMAAELEDVDIRRDATDCRTAFEAGTITLEDGAATTAAPTAPTPPPALPGPQAPAAPSQTAEIDFGDDSSNWADDGECDDPRFTGSAMAETLEAIDIMKDATDCRTAFEAGTITLSDGSTETASASEDGTIDFGDDTSEWANDQECDDPRFSGSGMATELDDVNIGRDATDCRNAYGDGTITLDTDDEPATAPSSTSNAWLAALANRIDFGDDSGGWPNDGECDDPDFVGSGAVSGPLGSDRMKDATDCRAAFIAGTVTLKTAGPVTAFDYGSDFSQWANDGQCDDWRFGGPGMAKKLTSDDVLADATDCRALEAEGQVSIRPVYQPGYALNGPYDSSGIEFGDNSSSYANDNLCDDPRFEGPGAATTLLDSDRMADAADCRAAYEQGTITLRDGEV